ncbi:MAG: glycine cleavage system aminomethyltransferase GcvT [Pseudomonadota bacterium]
MADAELARTPLADLHDAMNARMVGFAGYALPVQYPAGVLREHLHCREAAALFDVSHMGQIEVPAHAAAALEALMPTDLLGLAPGRQRYAVLTTPEGGVIDDLMIARLADRFLLVVNAARKAVDFAHLQAHLGASDGVEAKLLRDRALIALQGPAAETALARHAPEIAQMRFLDVREIQLAGTACILSRAGYTGEDGFEISVPAAEAAELARLLLDAPEVAPAGLGARDSLRLEAGLCLYGAELDETISPVEAGLAWALPKLRRRGGARAGGFPGAKRILAELADGPSRRRVGLRPGGRAPIRGGAALFATADEASDAAIGAISSGGFGPSLGAPIAMGYVPQDLAAPGTRLFAALRGRREPVTVAPLPFHPAGYKRN